MQGKAACLWGGIVKPSSFGRRAAVRSPGSGKATFPIGKALAIPGAVSKGLPVTGVVILASTGVSIVALRVTPLEWLSVVAVFLTWPSVPGVLPGKCMDWSEGSPCFQPVSQGLNHSINVTIEEGCMGW